jgi:hypothetical protein
LEDETSDEKSNVKSSGSTDTAGPKLEQKEVLLCLRPIRDGDKVDESLRFAPPTRSEATLSAALFNDPIVSSSSGGNNTQDDKADSDRISSSAPSNQSFSKATGSSLKEKKRPPKKRALKSTNADDFPTHEDVPKKRTKTDVRGHSSNSSDTEKSVVESLMLMNKLKSSQ